MTPQLEEQLKQNPLYSHDGDDKKDIKIICKYFITGSRFTFYVTEGEKKNDGDFEFFGYCKSSVSSDFDALEYLWLSQLRELTVPLRNSLMVVDMEMCDGLTLKDVMDTKEVI